MKQWFAVAGVLLILGSTAGAVFLFGGRARPKVLATNADMYAAGQTRVDPSNSSAVSTSRVRIQDGGFSPAVITIKKGTTVTWVNHDTAQQTVSSNAEGGPSSGALDPEGGYSFVFDKAGTYTYYSSTHPGMTGTVWVTD